MTSLFAEVRTEANLFSAWRHVKRSALNSPNKKIRGLASEFEHHHQRHLKRIASQLRKETFVFDDVEGILKDKKERAAKGKDPRPITLGSIKNRVVQRAILQILQPRTAADESDINTKFTPKQDPRLGSLNLINHSKFGVGGLMSPYGGVKPAIKLIMEAMANGATYYFQSDIKSFFTKIPTEPIIKKIYQETNDEKITNLFAKGLEINLSNKEELTTYAKLFPANGIGVAQGSSLSAFAGNVLLYYFDNQLNDMGVTAVRYIDDLLIVSPSKELLDKAVSFSKQSLSSFGFSLYPPTSGSDKASQGECKNGFNFLGCTLQPNRCVPSKGSIKKVNFDVQKAISASKSGIKKFISGEKMLEKHLSQSNTLHNLGNKLFGWEKSFSFCTDAQPFQDLDSKIMAKISDYEHWVHHRSSDLPPAMRMKILGIPSAAELFEHESEKKRI